ncbi:MAG TPA: LpqB family beta-propeller domain-containing protein [Nocardioidaceae bacterium]|nr:LpqB family beta-propeller domain-containing protein [Nocardioidaceae bacterium]
MTRSPSRPAGRRLLPLLLVLVALLVTGCVSLPVSGPVAAGPSVPAGTDEAPYDFNPAGPPAGGSPVDIVDGFLLSMQATPQSTVVARQFLTPESRSNWSPDSGTLIYGSYSLAAGSKAVTVRLADTARLGGRGEWLGETPGKGDLALHLRLVKVRGQWRISDPPDALIIPRTHFETRFQAYDLYFFDRSGQVLVPEPVYLPLGDQAPTLLVRGLLRGPDKEMEGATRSYIPPKTRLDDLSVPVSRQGVATVSLSDPMLGLGADERQLALAQLGWTLAQVSGVDRMRILVNGSPLEAGGQGPEPSVDSWSQYDPTVSWASHELFGLRDGHVVAVLDGAEHRLPGGLGQDAPPVRSIALDLAAQRLAAVSQDGSTVLLSRPQQPAKPTAGTEQPAYTGGHDLLKPAWDLYGQLWLLDRTAGGAVLTVLRGDTPTVVQAPGISGRDVTAFSVSRDGTRLVAVLAGHGRRTDRMVMARVMRSPSGQVTSLTAARPIPVASAPVRDILDVAWFSPTTVAVLASPDKGLCRVYLSRVDGSSGFVDSPTGAELFRGKAVRVVTAPAPGAPVYLQTPSRRLYALGSSGRWTDAGIRPGLLSPTFVG